MKKFNVLDILIVLAIVLCIVGAVFRFTGNNTAYRTASKTFDYVVKVESVRNYSVNALEKCAEESSAVTDSSKNTAVGNVYRIESVPAREAMQLADGSVKWCDVIDRYDVYVYIRAEGEITPQSFVCKSGTEILMNRENYYTTPWSGFYGTVMDVGENLEDKKYTEN